MQVFDRESGLAPALEPSAQRVSILVTVGVQNEGHPGARRLSRLRAVEDHLAVFPDPLMWIVQRFGARFALIVGDNEMAAGRYTLKNMTTGEQEFLTQDEVAAKLAAASNAN